MHAIMIKRVRVFATVAALCAVLAIMAGITSYSVTLYRMFCAFTGANGTTQRVAANDATQTDRTVTVFFDTSVSPALPWKFAPVQRSVKIHLGQDALVFFTAENESDQDLVGHATFNVTPEKAGLYFKKIQCFCFNEERLAAHQKVEMPVDFFVDPRLATDPNTEDVHEITLFYTFFHSLKPAGAIDLARFTSAPADAVAGAKLFAEECSACHALDKSKIGPALGGVFGRHAGVLAGYPYSAALAHSGVVWTAANLDKWLTDPAVYVPGAQMPMQVTDAMQRRDIVAYLQSVSKPGS
jgi:cytochrome c oxidase assembly protein Cox11